MLSSARLMFFCGKMAAGKSTLARQLAAEHNAILIEQDALVERLFPNEIVDIPTYRKFSARIRSVVGPLTVSLLQKGTNVVLDFPGNTRDQRAWFKALAAEAGVGHELHYIEASDALCKRQLKFRSKDLPPGTPWTSEAEFDMIMAHFLPPQDDETFHVVFHKRD